MGWRFRKSFKIFPGVRLNLGKKGITSATVGRGGWFSTNLSKRGIRQNINVPGTGVTYQSPHVPFSSDAPQQSPQQMNLAGNTSRNAGIAAVVLAAVVGTCAVCRYVGSYSSQGTLPLPSSSPYPTPYVAVRPSPTPIRSPTPFRSAKQKGAANKVPVAVPAPLLTRPDQASKYVLGPRGGCYYINSHGNKTYVEHSYCY